MVLPAFDMNGVLPPYLNDDPTLPENHSPYRVDLNTFVVRFATTSERLEILKGFLKFRAALHAIGLKSDAWPNGRGAFHWLDGSFLEDCEKIRGAPPKDLDLVTFFPQPLFCKNRPEWLAYINANEQLFDPEYCKATFMCDAYPVDLGASPRSIVDNTRYWFGLYAHQRMTGTWKGMVQIPLSSPMEDESSANYLHGLRLP